MYIKCIRVTRMGRRVASVNFDSEEDCTAFLEEWARASRNPGDCYEEVRRTVESDGGAAHHLE